MTRIEDLDEHQADELHGSLLPMKALLDELERSRALHAATRQEIRFHALPQRQRNRIGGAFVGKEVRPRYEDLRALAVKHRKLIDDWLGLDSTALESALLSAPADSRTALWESDPAPVVELRAALRRVVTELAGHLKNLTY